MNGLAEMGVLELSPAEGSLINGGADPVSGAMVAYTTLVVTTAAAAFKWGYDNLGPIFNKWI